MRSNQSLNIAIASVALLLVAGCAEKAPEQDAAETTQAKSPDAAAEAVDRSSAGEDGPGLTTSAAPGVAFSYNYAFTLPAKAISGVQQQHAVACERLGPQRCKITGMSYDQPRKDEVSARLDLELAPELAQRFGIDAIAAAERADGTLETAQVNGENAGGAIDESQRRTDTARASLDRIEKRLAVKGLGADERQQLVQRADELRGQLREEVQLRGGKEAAITLTPMTIAYGSEGLFASNGNPFGNAAKASIGSMDALLTTLLTLAGIALPWLLVLAVIVLAVRFYRLKRQLAASTGEAPQPQ
jgi:hypothetical protein